MCTIYEQTNDITADLSRTYDANFGAPAEQLRGWRNRGNISTPWDGSKITLQLGDAAKDASYSTPLPDDPNAGAGFSELAVPDAWRLYVDIQPSAATPSTATEWCGAMLRYQTAVQWITIRADDHLWCIKSDAGVSAVEDVGALPASASKRWQLGIYYDDTGLLVRARAHEDDGDVDAWVALRPSSSVLPGAPEWVGLGIVSAGNPVAADIHAIRIQYPETPARFWSVLADTPCSLEVVTDLLARKNRAASLATWSRDDELRASSPRSFANYSPTQRL